VVLTHFDFKKLRKVKNGQTGGKEDGPGSFRIMRGRGRARVSKGKGVGRKKKSTPVIRIEEGKFLAGSPRILKDEKQPDS